MFDRLGGLEGGRCRLGILGVVAVVSLVLADRSLAAITPRLLVTSSATAAGPQTLSISGSSQKTDDQVGRIQLFVPIGFTLDSPPPGTRVGAVSARFVARGLSSAAEQSSTGSVTAISPTDPAVAYEGTSCDPGQHLAAWMARLGTGRTALSFPIFVDASSDATASFGPYVLVVCFRPANLAAADPNRSPGGRVIDSWTLTLTPFTAPTTAGGYLWRSLWTPFAAATGALDPTASVEAQSTVNVLAAGITIEAATTTLELHGTPVTLLIVSGRVLVDGQVQPGALVRIRHGPRSSELVALGRVRTGSDGIYVQVSVLRATQYLEASVSVPGNDLGSAGCQPSFADTPCLDATTSTGNAATPTVLVKR